MSDLNKQEYLSVKISRETSLTALRTSWMSSSCSGSFSSSTTCLSSGCINPLVFTRLTLGLELEVEGIVGLRVGLGGRGLSDGQFGHVFVELLMKLVFAMFFSR